jgi:hypothetical protein
MAGIIRVSENLSWSAANWAYWCLMDHLISALPARPDVVQRVEGCKWMQSLNFSLLREDDPETADLTLATLKHVASRCASGALTCMVDGKLLDNTSQKQFRESMTDLVKMLSSEAGLEGPAAGSHPIT